MLGNKYLGFSKKGSVKKRKEESKRKRVRHSTEFNFGMQVA